MKTILNYLFLLPTLLFGITINAQLNSKSIPIMKFTIESGQNNLQDVTDDLISVDAYLIFYMEEGPNEFNFANVWPKAESQSYGTVEFISSKVYPAKGDFPSHSVNNYYWNYNNTYDDNKGLAILRVVKIFQEDKTLSLVEITTDKGAVLTYFGKVLGGMTSAEIEDAINGMDEELKKDPYNLELLEGFRNDN